MDIQSRNEIVQQIIKILLKHHCTVKDLNFIWIGLKDKFYQMEVTEKEH